jgi:hypothetical protein
MTPEAFRTLALSFPRAQERPILGSQEFRCAAAWKKDPLSGVIGA